MSVERLSVLIEGRSDLEKTFARDARAADKFGAKVEGVFSRLKNRTITANVEADGVPETVAGMEAVKQARDRASGTAHVDVDFDKDGVDGLTSGFGRLASGIRNTGTVLAASKIPFMLAGIGGAIPTVTALAASTGGLALSLGRAGAGFTLVGGAAGGGALVGLKAYAAGISSTISASREAYTATHEHRMEMLEQRRQAILTTRASDAFNREMDQSTIVLTKLQAEIGRGSFPIFTRELDAWNGELRSLTPELAQTTTGVSRIAAGFSEWFRTAEDGRVLNRTVGFVLDSAVSGASVLHNLGKAGVLALQPLIPLARGLQRETMGLANSAAEWTEKAENQSKLGKIYRGLWTDAKRLGGALMDTGRGVVNTFDAIDRAGLDDQAFSGLERISSGFARITSKGTEGRRTLNSFLVSSRELMPSVTGAVGAFGRQIGRVARELISAKAEGSKLTVLQETFRGLEKSARPLGNLLISTFKGLGPEIPELVTNVSRLAEVFAGSSGPLVTYFRILNRAAGIFNSLPGPVKTAAANALALKLVLGGFGAPGVMAGVGSLVDFRQNAAMMGASVGRNLSAVERLKFGLFGIQPAATAAGASAVASGKKMGAAGAAAATSGKKMGLLGKIGRLAGAGFRILGTALRFVLGPWGLLITAVTVGAVLIYRNWDRIVKAAQPVVGAFKRVWGVVKQLGSFVGSVFVGNMAKARKTFASLPESVQPFARALGHGTAVVRNFAQRALGWLQDKAQQFVVSWRKHWPEVRTVVGSALSGAGRIVRRVGGAAFDWLRDKVGNVVSWWRENVPLFKKTVQTVFGGGKGGGLGGIISGSIKGAVSVVKSVWGGLVRWWDHNGERVISVARSTWKIVGTVIDRGVRILGNVIKLGMQVITGDWRGAWNTVERIGELAWSGLKTVVREGWKILGHLFVIGKDALIATGKKIWSGLGFLWERGTSALTNKLRDWRDGVRGAFDGLANWSHNRWSDFWNWMGNFWGDRLTSVTSKVSDWKDNVSSVFGNLASGLKERWDGMWSGLGARWSQFKTNFGGGVQDFIGKVKGWFSDGFGALNGIMGGKLANGVNTVRKWLGTMMWGVGNVLSAIGAPDMADSAKDRAKELQTPIKFARGGRYESDPKGGVVDRPHFVYGEAGEESLIRTDKWTPESARALQYTNQKYAERGWHGRGSGSGAEEHENAHRMALGGIIKNGVRHFASGGMTIPNSYGGAPVWITPGTAMVNRAVESQFPEVTGTSYPNHGRHADGSISLDYGLPSGGNVTATGSSKALGDSIASFLQSKWDQFSTEYLIWFGKMKESSGGPWSVYDGGGGYDPPTTPQGRHEDHVHYSGTREWGGAESIGGPGGSGGALSAVGSFFGNIVNRVKDKFGGVWKSATDLVDHYFLDKIPLMGDPDLGVVGKGMMGFSGKLMGMAKSWLFDQTAEKLGITDKDPMPSGGGAMTPSGDIEKWIVAGLRADNLFPANATNVAGYKRLGDTESGWDPRAVQQITDVNSTMGGAGGFDNNLARGALQNTPQSWEGNRGRYGDDPGQANPNIFDPVKSVMMRARNQMAALGHISFTPGYRRGGIIPGAKGERVLVQAHAGERVWGQETVASMDHLARSVEVWSAREKRAPAGQRADSSGADERSGDATERRLEAIERRLEKGIRVTNMAEVVRIAEAYHGSPAGKKQQSLNMAKEINAVTGTRPESR